MSEIELRPFSETDFPRLIECFSTEEELLRWAGHSTFKHPLTREQLERYLQSANLRQTARLFTVVERGLGPTLGHIELSRIDAGNGTATITHVYVDPLYRGRGLCRWMISEILNIGFNEFPLHRIDLVVYDNNIPAIACYQRSGFVREGVLRKAVRIGDQFWNGIFMSILREEWERLARPTED